MREIAGAFRASRPPVTTPIGTASSYVHENTATLDRVMGNEEPGWSYARYASPTNAALEELLAELEGGAAALACASGMMAIQTALMVALTDRPKRILAAGALYGATTAMLTKIMEPLGVETMFIDICDLPAVERRMASFKPGCVICRDHIEPAAPRGRHRSYCRDGARGRRRCRRR